ncbi:MAG: hypothetical protein HPM95_12940 [Alphaproteobacteria bacterium]|nr:hypothetical protein [Alphaproteobacteria bacterium]
MAEATLVPKAMAQSAPAIVSANFMAFKSLLQGHKTSRAAQDCMGGFNDKSPSTFRKPFAGDPVVFELAFATDEAPA